MGIPVHGGADVRVSSNGLQGFDVQVRCCHRYISVPKHMRRCPMHAARVTQALQRKGRQNDEEKYQNSLQIHHRKELKL